MIDELIMFMGLSCPHCEDMKPLVERLEKESKINVTKLEVWHNAANERKFHEMDNGFCGGVPLFVNTKTGKKICGSTSYDKLKAWALGK